VKKRKLILIAGISILAAMLLINPRLTNPPLVPGRDALASNMPPAEVVRILHNSCYDCHSDQTKWPWYSHVAPFSWWLVDHVEDGRKRLNFSNWPHDDPKRAARKWRSISEAVADGDMPLPSYLKGHSEARLTDEQRKRFSDWAEGEADRVIDTLNRKETQ
jgi:hypothetical protein